MDEISALSTLQPDTSTAPWPSHRSENWTQGALNDFPEAWTTPLSACHVAGTVRDGTVDPRALAVVEATAHDMDVLDVGSPAISPGPTPSLLYPGTPSLPGAEQEAAFVTTGLSLEFGCHSPAGSSICDASVSPVTFPPVSHVLDV